MKKKIVIPAMLVIALLVLFLPIPTAFYDDGGTREYTALTYKIVQWNRFVSVYNESGEMVRVDQYKGTSVYWFPHHHQSIDELWKMEQASQES